MLAAVELVVVHQHQQQVLVDLVEVVLVLVGFQEIHPQHQEPLLLVEAVVVELMTQTEVLVVLVS
jgi:hypothetical protein